MEVRYCNNATYFSLSMDDIEFYSKRHMKFPVRREYSEEQLVDALVKYYGGRRCLDNWATLGIINNMKPMCAYDGTPEGVIKMNITQGAQEVHDSISSRVNGLARKLEYNNFNEPTHYAGIVWNPSTGATDMVHSDYFESRERTSQEPVETAAANPVESPVEPAAEPVPEGDFPLTMAQVSRKVSPFGGKLKSKYDFGQFAVNKPSSVPTLERALREYTRHHVYAIARALILRKYGLTVTKEEVFAAANGAFKTYSNTAPYRAVMKEHREDSDTNKAVENVASLYEKVLNGNVDLDWKKFRKNDTYGKPWDIGSFFIYMTDGLHISPKAVTKRKSKKKIGEET